jgi:hypothetical protein
MANMWDLTGTYLAANYRKVRPSTQLGTRVLRIVTVTFDNGSDSDIDLTAAYASGTGTFAGSYLDHDSYFSKAVIALQTFGEVWVIGKPDATNFTVIMSDDTAQDAAMDTNVVVVPGNWGQAEALLAASVGIGAKAGLATAYNGVVTITDKYLNGAGLSSVSTAADKF